MIRLAAARELIADTDFFRMQLHNMKETFPLDQ